MPRRPPVHRGVRAGGCAGAGRGPLCQDNMRALPLAVPLPSEAGPACGGLRPQGGPGEGKHRAAPKGRGHRGVAQAVCHKGWDRGNELRAEARPRAWALAGARGPPGTACSLPEGVGVQLQADGPCPPGGDGEHGSAGGRDGTCGRGRMKAPLRSFHRALRARKGYRNGITLVLSAADGAMRPATGIPWRLPARHPRTPGSISNGPFYEGINVEHQNAFFKTYSFISLTAHLWSPRL